jgi:hypothetical protein
VPSRNLRAGRRRRDLARRGSENVFSGEGWLVYLYCETPLFQRGFSEISCQEVVAPAIQCLERSPAGILEEGNSRGRNSNAEVIQSPSLYLMSLLSALKENSYRLRGVVVASILDQFGFEAASLAAVLFPAFLFLYLRVVVDIGFMRRRG